VTALTRFGVELRSRLDGDTLYGHAAVFGQVAQVPGGWEQLARSAFDDALTSPDADVRALVNHDPSKLLARQEAGTLRLGVDDEGLAFEVDLPDTSYARDLRALVERGDLTGASFGFIPGDDDFDRAPDGRQRRTHTRVARLVDVSAVTFPAYEGAGVALRHHEFARPGSRSRLIRARARVMALTGGAPK
jgi:hypothetical protein